MIYTEGLKSHKRVLKWMEITLYAISLQVGVFIVNDAAGSVVLLKMDTFSLHYNMRSV